MWGLAFGDDFWSPSWTGSDGGLMSGMETDEGDLEKLSVETKNATLQQYYRTNFGVLSIK